MVKLNDYIFKHFFHYFFSIFLPLFTIASIIIIVKIASKTAVIHVDMIELLQIYLFFLPTILFYTMPLSFFIGATLTISKLSFDYELVVLFAMGINPNKILKVFLLPTIVLGFILMFLFIFIIPHTKQLNNNFQTLKKTQTQFDIKATEFGQKFGDWFVFIDKKPQDDLYENIVLYKKEKKDEIFIQAQYAKISNNKGLFSMNLENGITYKYTQDKVEQINFKIMIINDTVFTKNDLYLSILQYWQYYFNDTFKKEHEREYKSEAASFSLKVLISFFPLLGIFLFLTFGVSNSRHEKSHQNLYMFITITIFFSIASLVTKYLLFWSIPVFIVIWLLITYYIYKRKILTVY